MQLKGTPQHRIIVTPSLVTTIQIRKIKIMQVWAITSIKKTVIQGLKLIFLPEIWVILKLMISLLKHFKFSY